MTVFVPKELWSRSLQEWIITDCAIRSRNFVYLVARKSMPEEDVISMWDHDIPTRLVLIDLDESPENSLDHQNLGNFNRPHCGVARKPVPQGLIAARNLEGDTWATGSGLAAMEEIDTGHIPMNEKIKCIDDYAYSVGGGRRIYKRTDIGQWNRINNGFPEEEAGFEIGFSDLDGFSESDMYAVGGHGDIWHYDGTIWIQEGFPGNMQLNTVTCAGDGYVYVSGQGGTLWRGRHSTWEKLYEGSSSIPWNDVLWFEDKLWLASDYMLQIWDGTQLVSPKDGSGKELHFISGDMDAYDGLLVVASSSRVEAYQNGNWRTLILPYE